VNLKQIKVKNWTITIDHYDEEVDCIRGYVRNDKTGVEGRWTLYLDGKDVQWFMGNLRPLPKYVVKEIKKLTIKDVNGELFGGGDVNG